MAFGGGFWAARPRPLTLLKKDKAIGSDAHRGFADTFNWMANWIANFRVGPGLSFTGGDKGKPRVDLNVVDSNGVPVSEYPDEDTPVNELGGGGEVTVTGTDGNSCTGSDFTYVSAANSNVTVSVDDQTGNMTIGAYYI